ncbi:DNA-binding transcriptional LysR family regulator [Rhodovulum sulfidophilum]|uniref:LysR family transcriptional regulator n=1 Tax=Rhodovulum sulfidophilum TaxID=35806 RepID=UPI0005AB5378|nr:LysR family transcriptional regulator [Rhodovulum sulfidophilum]ANB33914.1 LysR family transcriptional regulator [Rhodovulum sulfidophilum DSM 1374]ANB37736.1 LysR family transcriptional regulator [Rhodovulum sulfidophilum]MCW2304310.1 DNA-binding transcriptional LysR family regulator [Rhodovulum sulfidophilum]
MPPSTILGRLPGLRHFIEVAQQGSFRAAADKLHVAPSAVSKQIKNLELALDVELFRRDRGRGGLEVTEAGEILLFRCASVVNELTIAQDEIDQLHGLHRGQLRLGVNEVLASDLLPGILRDMSYNHPGLKFHIVVENTREIVQRLQTGDIDIGLGYNFPPSPDIETLATLRRRTYAITALDHPMARLRDVRLEDIDGERVIFPDSSIAMREMLEKALAQAGVEVREVMSTNSFTLLRQMVESGMGIGIVFGRFLQTRRERIAFVEVNELPFASPPVACCRMAGRTPTVSSEAFAAAIKTIFVNYGG